MNTDLSLYTETMTIGYSHCDRTGLAKLPILASFLQDMAMRHDMLINRAVLKSDKIMHLFALLRSNLCFTTLPSWKDEITVSTWLHPLENENRFLYRSFIFFNNEGAEIGYCTITAFAIDLVERKAKELPAEIKQFPTLDKSICTGVNSRIKRPKEIALEKSAVVLPGDIDMYNHVNNNRYLCWAIDHSPIEIQNNYVCKSSETQFRMELQEGQEFTCKIEIRNDENKGITATHHIVRTSDNTEIARIITKWDKRHD